MTIDNWLKTHPKRRWITSSGYKKSDEKFIFVGWEDHKSLFVGRGDYIAEALADLARVISEEEAKG
jgi:hypothetical protein